MAKDWAPIQRKRFATLARRTATAVSSPSVASVAHAAYSGVKYLRSLVNSEVHKKDKTGDPFVNSSGTVIALTDIFQGDRDFERTGNSVLLSAVNIDLTMVKASTPATTFVRYILFQDKQQISDTVPAVTDILKTPIYNDFINRDTAGRFKILSSKVVTLTGNTPTRRVKTYHKFKGHHVRFNGTSDLDIQRGGIYMLLLSDQISTNNPQVRYNTRAYFHDN